MLKQQQCRRFFLFCLVLPIATGTHPLLIPLAPMLLDHPNYLQLTPSRCPLHPVLIIIVQIHPPWLLSVPGDPYYVACAGKCSAGRSGFDSPVSVGAFLLLRVKVPHVMSLCSHCILVARFQSQRFGDASVLLFLYACASPRPPSIGLGRVHII